MAFFEPRQIIRQLPVRFIFLLSLAGYGLIRLWLPLSPRYNQSPMADIRTFLPSLGDALAYAVLLLGLFVLYLLAFRRVRTMVKPPSLALIGGAAVLFGLPLLQTYPFNANDIYLYIFLGRITSVYHQNPFTEPLGSFDTSFLPLSGEWGDVTTPYGPVWELFAAFVTRLSGDNLYLVLVLFKGLALLAHLGITFFIWLLLSQAKTAARAAYTLLWAWNPALLLIFVADGHNDSLMLFWLVFGWWVVQRGRPAAGFILMVLAPLSKPIGLLALPFFFLGIWRQLPDNAARWRFLLFSASGSLLLTVAAFWPFGSPLPLVQRLIAEAGFGGYSPTALIILLMQSMGLPLSAGLVTGTATILFLLALLWFLWQTWLGRSPLRGTADSFILYVLQAFSFRIWYAAWAFPFLLLDNANRPDNGRLVYRRQVGLWFLLTTQLSVLIYGHLRVALLGGSHLWAHLIGVPFTFGLPFLLGRWHCEPGVEWHGVEVGRRMVE